MGRESGRNAPGLNTGTSGRVGLSTTMLTTVYRVRSKRAWRAYLAAQRVNARLREALEALSRLVASR